MMPNDSDDVTVMPGGTATAARPVDAAMARARALMALGPGLVDALGQTGGEALSTSLPLMQRAADDSSDLLAVNQALLPLMTALGASSKRLGWWQWFTGERLEREVFFHDLQARIEDLARRGDQGLAALRAQARALKAEDQAMAGHIAHLDAEVAAGQLLMGELQSACSEVGLSREDQARLSRRIANLQAMATATQLTRGQYEMALSHARSVADRFIETRSLLLPLWKQAMGFELFSQRLARTDEGN